MVSYESRKRIFNSIPILYETLEGMKFKINKYQGENEMPEAKIPFIVLIWGFATGGKRFVSDYLGMVMEKDVTNSNETQDEVVTLRNDEYIEFVVYPETKFVSNISIYTKARSNGARARLFAYRLNKDNEWELIATTFVFDFSIQLGDFTDFPINFFTIKGEPIKFRLQIWDFEKYGKIEVPVRLVSSEWDFDEKIPIFNLTGSLRSKPRYGQIEKLSLDVRLGLGDIGLLGGQNYIPSRVQAKRIYDTLLPRILQKWTPLVNGGFVKQVGNLMKISGGIMEEGQWTFTIDFEYENSSVIQEPRYPIEEIRKKRVYIKE